MIRLGRRRAPSEHDARSDDHQSMRAFVLSHFSLSLVTHPPHPYYRHREREHSTTHSPHSRCRTRVFSNVVSGGAVCACRVSVVLARPEPDPAPAEHVTYHRTFDHIINQISDRHDQQQQGTEHGFTTRQTNGRLAKTKSYGKANVCGATRGVQTA